MTYARWHQDIKPENILVFSGVGTSPFDVHFKIADLSLCHFKRSKDLVSEDSNADTDSSVTGTRTYGRKNASRNGLVPI